VSRHDIYLEKQASLLSKIYKVDITPKIRRKIILEMRKSKGKTRVYEMDLKPVEIKKFLKILASSVTLHLAYNVW